MMVTKDIKYRVLVLASLFRDCGRKAGRLTEIDRKPSKEIDRTADREPGRQTGNVSCQNIIKLHI